MKQIIQQIAKAIVRCTTTDYGFGGRAVKLARYGNLEVCRDFTQIVFGEGNGVRFEASLRHAIDAPGVVKRENARCPVPTAEPVPKPANGNTKGQPIGRRQTQLVETASKLHVCQGNVFADQGGSWNACIPSVQLTKSEFEAKRSPERRNVRKCVCNFQEI